MWRMMMRRRRSDRGATVVLVAIVVSVVLLGVAAVVLNTGSWFAERGQLQNGADAAALAVADSCAGGTCDVTLADAHANSNANDNLTTVDVVCGYSGNALSPLPPCTSQQIDGHYCPAAPAAGISYVNVHVSTKTTSGDSIPVIGKLSGKPEHVKACAQAQWGTPGSAQTLPITISDCDWYKATANGTKYAAEPPYEVAPSNTSWPTIYPYSKYDAKKLQLPAPGGEDVLPLHGTATTSSAWDFENGQPDVGRDWTFDPKPSGRKAGVVGTAVMSPSPVYSGTYSMQVTWIDGSAGSEKAYLSNQQTISGQQYKFTMWVYVPTGSAAVSLYVNGATAVSLSPATQAGDDAWHQLTATFTAGNNVDVGITTAVDATAGQQVYVDTVFLGLTQDPTCLGAAVTPPSGFDMPGGFGWLYDPNSDCSVVVNANDTVFDNTGNAMDKTCPSKLQDAACDQYNGEVTPPCQPKELYVPVFDGYCSNSSTTCSTSVVCGNLPSGSNGCYHVLGFAKFVLTGYALTGGNDQRSSIPPSFNAYCSGNDKCIYGAFTQGIVHEPPGRIIGGGGLGATVVSLTG